MKEQKIEQMIFDYGGVIGFTPRLEISNQISKFCDIDHNKISQIIRKNTIKMQKRKVSEEDFWKNISKDLKVNDLDSLTRVWIESVQNLSKIDLDVLAFLDDLSRFYKLSLLSNSTQLYTYSPFRNFLGRIFSIEIYSCDVGFRKPEKEIYDITLARLDIQPCECVIIDDEPENLIYPASIGMGTIHYKSLEDLRSRIAKN